MPRIKSAKKRMRQTKARTAENRAQRSTLRTAIRKAKSATGEAVADAAKAAESLIDRAGRKNLVHRNTAARAKSKLAKLANAAKAS